MSARHHQHGGNGGWHPGDPDRRHSSPEERETFKKDHRMELELENYGKSRPWEDSLSKPFLVTVITVILGPCVWYEKSWRDDVGRSMSSVGVNSERISKLEQAEVSHEKSIGSIQIDVGKMREDQLSFYRWTAERTGDFHRAALYGTQLGEVQTRNAQVEAKVGPLPLPTPVPAATPKVP